MRPERSEEIAFRVSQRNFDERNTLILNSRIFLLGFYHTEGGSGSPERASNLFRLTTDLVDERQEVHFFTRSS